MTTDVHILNATDIIYELKSLINKMPESADHQLIMSLFRSLNDEMYNINNVLNEANNRISELTHQLYEPIEKAQSATEEYCRYIDRDAVQQSGVYTLPEFEKMLRQACEGDAHTLGQVLRKYEKMKYLDFRGESKKRIYNYLREHFPTMRKYSYAYFTMHF